MRTILPAVVILCACSPSIQSEEASDGVRLGAVPTAAGDSIVLTLTNGSAGDIGYNLCASGVERRTGDAWEPVPTDRVCTMELRTLQAGSTVTYTTALPPATGAGDYRFLTTVENFAQGTRLPVRSNVMRVSS